MKIKKIEWKEIDINYLWEDKLIKWFSIIQFEDNVFDLLLNNSFIERFSTFEEAEDHCKFVLENIINSSVDLWVKPFDPTLLGFELFEDFEIRQSDYKVFHLKSNRNINIYLQFKSMKNTWAMWEDENKNHSIIAFELGFFQEVKIPDHDFGVKLISQFLGDKV